MGYWPLDNDAKDYWSTNNGTASGGYTQNSSGVVGGSYGFNGTSGTLSGPATSFPANNAERTISFWVKFLADRTNYIFSYGSVYTSGGCYGIISLATSGYLQLSDCRASPIVSTNFSLHDGKWHHVVTTHNASNLNVLYVDGTQAGTSTQALTTTGVTSFYLSDWGGTGGYLNGTIDEVMVFNRALSGTEVSQLYYGGLYDGNKIGAEKTTIGDIWKAGVSSNSTGGNNWTPDANSGAVTITAVPCGTGLTAGMLGYWKADGNMADSYGTNHGNLARGSFTYSPGIIGQAFDMPDDGEGTPLVLQGTDINVGQVPGFNYSALTVSAWVYMKNTGYYNRYFGIVTKEDLAGNGKDTFELGRNQGLGTQFTYYNSGWVSASITATPIWNTWHHYVGTFNGTNMKIYYDGVLTGTSATTSATLPTTTTNIHIGGSPWTNSIYGLVDEVAIFNRAMNATEIAQLYAKGVAGKSYCG